MNIFNRRELRVGRSMEEMALLKERLSGAGIPFAVRAGSGWPGRSHGVPGVRAEAAYEYRLYVHRRDYARAKAIMD